MRTLGRIFVGIVLTGLGVVYLLNPGWGIAECIPDNLALVGNIDEAIATIILLKGLSLVTGRTVTQLPGRVRSLHRADAQYHFSDRDYDR